jgi:hypothetical protein
LTNTPELDDPLDAAEPDRLFDLRQDHDPASARGARPIVQVAIFAEAADHELAILEGKLAGKVQEAVRLDGGHVGRHRSGGLRKGDSRVRQGGRECQSWRERLSRRPVPRNLGRRIPPLPMSIQKGKYQAVHIRSFSLDPVYSRSVRATRFC